MQMNSLRARLLALLLGTVGTGTVLIALAMYFSTRHEIGELFDAQLSQSARNLIALALDNDEDPALFAFQSHGYERKLNFVIRDRQGTILLRSHEGTEQPFTPTCQDRFSWLQADHVHWRHYCLWSDDHTLQIDVTQREDARGELTRRILTVLLVPLLIGLPLLGILIWFSVSRGLQPLQRMSGELAARSPRQLDPIDPDGAPTEIQPLIAALNQLLLQLQQAFEQERRFTADAAHELRTPLAALRAQAEVTRRQTKEIDTQTRLDKVISAADRATKLIEQLLTLARLDHVSSVNRTTMDLRALAVEAIGDFAEKAHKKQIDLGLADGEPCFVLAEPNLLRVLLRNLLDNALRYTPDGGMVTVRVDQQSLWVCDSGPGIPARAYNQVLQRFFRGPDVTESGSGLGLSIVARIAELHQATLTLGKGIDGAGLSVRVHFMP